MPLVESITEMEALAKEARASGFVAFDTETTGLTWPTCRMVGASFCFDGKTGYYIVDEKLLTIFARIMGDVKVIKAAHNAKFDLHFLREAGIITRGPVYDTEIMSRIADENEPTYKLKTLTENRWPGSAGTQGDLLKYMEEHGLKKTMNFAGVPAKVMAPYACMDAVLVWKLYDHMNMVIDKQDATFSGKRKDWSIPSQQDLLFRETLITRIAEKMEERGVPVDVEFLATYREELIEELGVVENDIYIDAGTKFNIDSDRELIPIMKSFGWIPKKFSEKTNNPTLDKFAMKDWEHPFSAKILNYRRVSKLISTYCEGITKRAVNGLLHCDYRTNGARTGRFSCTNPNLQNIDKKSKARQAFVVRPGYVNYYLDFKQIELAVFAFYANDMTMAEAMWDGKDFHRMNASVMYNIPEDEVTSDQRDKAKTMNFALLYGAGVPRTAKMLGVSQEEAGTFRERYLNRFKSVRELRQKTEGAVRRRGFIVNRFGRRRRLTSRECYKAMNALIQGASADLMKEAMIRVDVMLPKGVHMLMQVHDEICIEVPTGEGLTGGSIDHQAIAIDAATAMASVQELMDTIPIRVDISLGDKDWSEEREIGYIDNKLGFVPKAE